MCRSGGGKCDGQQDGRRPFCFWVTRRAWHIEVAFGTEVIPYCMAAMFQAVSMFENRPEGYEDARCTATTRRIFPLGSVFNFADGSRLVNVDLRNTTLVTVGVRGWLPSWVEFPESWRWYVWEEWPRWGE